MGAARIGILPLVFVLAICSNLAGCSDDPVSPPRVDGISPGPITDLIAASVSDSTVLLTWTAPGDDGTEGVASTYDVRYGATADLSTATIVNLRNHPGQAGTSEAAVVPGSIAGFYQVRTYDDAGNMSYSNVAGGSDVYPPLAVKDLKARAIGLTDVELYWTATGDDGAVGVARAYDLRYTTDPVLLLSEGGWAEAELITGNTASDLRPNTKYYFALRAVDDAGNWSGTSNIASSTTWETPPLFFEAWQAGGSYMAVDKDGYVYVSGGSTTRKYDPYGALLDEWAFAGFDLAIDVEGYLYTGSDHTIQKYNQEGNLMVTFGSAGAEAGQFSDIFAITSDAASNLHVLDLLPSGEGRVQVFRPGPAANAPPEFVRQWLISPMNYWPLGMAVDQDYVYVLSEFGSVGLIYPMLQKFRKDGTLAMSVRSAGAGNMCSDGRGGVLVENDNSVLKFASDGAIRMWLYVDGSVHEVGADAERGFLYLLTQRGVEKYETLDPRSTLKSLTRSR